MKEEFKRALWIVLISCRYSLRYQRSRRQFLHHVFMRWGDWRTSMLDRAMTTTNHDEKVAIIEALERDTDAYHAAWSAYESQNILRDGKPYARKEVAA